MLFLWSVWYMQTVRNLMLLYNKGPLCLHRLTLIPAWLRNHMPGNVWDEITYAFPNFNGEAVKVEKG